MRKLMNSSKDLAWFQFLDFYGAKNNALVKKKLFKEIVKRKKHLIYNQLF